MDWLKFMELEPAGAVAEIDRLIGYWKSYAEGYADLDKDEGMQGEVCNAALTLRQAVLAKRNSKLVAAGTEFEQPRKK